MKDLVQQLDQRIAWDTFLADLAGWTLDESVRIQQIPAPTFAEETRACYVREQFARFGLADIDMDEQFNVYGRLRGVATTPGIMVMAHTDTVFPIETDLTVKPRDDLLYGPGLGDNSMGVAGMLALLKYLHDHALTPDCDLWFVATSCEEGLGDLKGVRMAYKRMESRIGAVINLEGMALGHIYHAGISSHRVRITVHTEGGHSWLHFGRPSAIHVLMQLGARITEITPPSSPRTTFNIGVIEGGQSVNSIAASASLLLDLRSEEQHELEKLKVQVNQLMADLPTDVRVSIEVVGDRPAGYMNPRHTLVQAAVQALRAVGIDGTLERGSTDGNIPLHFGCPCVTIGITRGGNAHRTDEYIQIHPIHQGVQQLILLTMAACQKQAALSIEGL